MSEHDIGSIVIPPRRNPKRPAVIPVVRNPEISPSRDDDDDDVPSPAGQEIMLAVLGAVGVGKTSFIDTINNKGRVRESTLEPC